MGDYSASKHPACVPPPCMDFKNTVFKAKIFSKLYKADIRQHIHNEDGSIKEYVKLLCLICIK